MGLVLIRLRSALVVFVVLITGCNPLYVIQAGITQSEILYNRRDIAEVLQDPGTPAQIQRKLELVSSARDFSQMLALKPGGTFQSYSALDRDVLAWIVLAAKPDSFTFYTWWFPIVGSVPYKGYFSLESAKAAALELQSDGYETLVRGTEAFSTLGWFNDPVMTPMLKNEDHQIVNTVIHEILHTTLWVPNYVSFNESLANFVGHQGAISFYLNQLQHCTESDVPCHESARTSLEAARKSLNEALDVSQTLANLIPELKELYQAERPREEKLQEREKIFARHIEPLRTRIPALKILKKAHNAELMQLQLYYSNLNLFLALWAKLNSDWKQLIATMQSIADESRDQGVDPFTLLSLQLKEPSAEKAPSP